MNDIWLSKEFLKKSSIGLVVTKENKEIVKINKALENMTGYKEGELIGKNIDILGSKTYNKEMYKEFITEINKNDYWEGVVWNRRKNGELFLIKRMVFLNKDEERNHKEFIILCIDLSEQQIKESQYQHYFYQDIITGLPNKYVFKKMLEKSLRLAETKEQKIAYLRMKVVKYERIYEIFGFEEGDQLLKKISERISEVAGKNVTITRKQSSIFGMYIYMHKEIELKKLLNKLLETFESTPFVIGGKEIYLTVNIGVAIFPEDGNDVDELYKNSIIASKENEELGLNSYRIYTKELRKETIEKIEIETGIRKALEKREFQLYYQPQIDIKTKNIIGLEALIRWKHAEKGFIPPVVFIPIAEETGLIKAIGEWALKEACKQLREWNKNGIKNIKVAVNVSSKQFKYGDLFEYIKSVIKETKINPEDLDLEITESDIMTNPEKTKKILDDLKKIGVKISIDDFGTGYSSLSYLAKYPVDYIKIDKSFITDISKNKTNESIVSTIIAMSKKLNMKVIAEGVETEEELNHLKKENCHYYQGYFYSPPVPKEQIAKKFKIKN